MKKDVKKQGLAAYNTPNNDSISSRVKENNKNFISLRKRIQSYQYLLLGIFISIVGIIILFLAFKSEVIKEIGIALTVAGIVGIAIEFFTRKQFLEIINDCFVSAYNGSVISHKLDSLFSLVNNDLFSLVKVADNFRELGLREIYKERNDERSYEIIRSAAPGSTIKLLGTCLQSFDGLNVQKIFIQKLNEGCNIELLVLNPLSEFVRQRGKEEKREIEDIIQSITYVNKIHSIFIKSLERDGLKGKITIDYYNAPPNLFLVITESTLLVGFYLRDRQGQFFPQIELEIKPAGISKPFITHFDSLMREAKEKGDTLGETFPSKLYDFNNVSVSEV